MGSKKRARNLSEKETEMELKLWEHDIPYLTEGTETPNTLHTYLIPTDKPLPCVIVFGGAEPTGVVRCTSRSRMRNASTATEYRR